MSRAETGYPIGAACPEDTQNANQRERTGGIMNRAILAVCIIALSPALALADPALIVSGGRLYLSEGDGTVATELGPSSLLERIHYMPGDTPIPPPDPDPDPDPDLNARAEQVRVFSVDVRDPDGAAIMAAVVGTLAEQGLPTEVEHYDAATQGKAAWDAALTVTIRAINGGQEPRWNQWKTNVGALSEGDYDTQFFLDVVDGLSAAYDLDAAVLSDIQGHVRSGTDAEAAADHLSHVHGESALDFAAIIQLIMDILALLRSLGIL